MPCAHMLSAELPGGGAHAGSTPSVVLQNRRSSKALGWISFSGTSPDLDGFPEMMPVSVKGNGVGPSLGSEGWRADLWAHTWQEACAPWSADPASPTPSLGPTVGVEASPVIYSDGPAQCSCLVLKARLPFVYSVFGHRIYKGKLSVSIKPWPQCTLSEECGMCVHDRVCPFGVWHIACGSPFRRDDFLAQG